MGFTDLRGDARSHEERSLTASQNLLLHPNWGIIAAPGVDALRGDDVDDLGAFDGRPRA